MPIEELGRGGDPGNRVVGSAGFFSGRLQVGSWKAENGLIIDSDGEFLRRPTRNGKTQEHDPNQATNLIGPGAGTNKVLRCSNFSCCFALIC